jgi:hypothetical protein
MSNKVDYEKGFIKVLMNTLQHLDKHYPTPETTIGLSTLKDIASKSTSTPIIQFMEYFYDDSDDSNGDNVTNRQFRENIRNYNVDFLINTNYVELKTEGIGKLFDFRSRWANFPQKTRDKITKNLRALVIICDEYIDLL